jgi:hypothetical protein
MPTLDRESLREIVSILKEHKRKDLIEILQDACDPDYKPPRSRRVKVDIYSESEGSAEEEEEFSVSVDADGLWSIS